MRKSRRKGRAAGQQPAEKHECEAARRLDEVTSLLLGRQAGGHGSVPVSILLDMLDPGHEKREKRHPLADPLTGTTWPGAPGTTPPE